MAGASKAALTIVGDGTLELSAGYYGSKTSTDVRVPTANRLDCITGGGVLYNRGIGGLLLLVR